MQWRQNAGQLQVEHRLHVPLLVAGTKSEMCSSAVQTHQMEPFLRKGLLDLAQRPSKAQALPGLPETDGTNSEHHAHKLYPARH
jgi:hypothetical protein